ncbi:protein HAIKU1-like [Olea europaea var. sylvestris]|uniref:protein HAIKU1-like n=1 Tax=Olea europaea var. sylvestris TaxID=158386 RepID=UPI000C1CFC7C|nr:protein HAIKU1-like [Olea europaea var. sylvestris]
MDNSNLPGQMNRQIDHLGVNKMGKNIKKSPLHQPNFSGPARQQPQPQVYNINKNDFRNIVQQLTGSPSQEPPSRPLQNPPKPASNRLQRIRPPPLAPMNQPQIPIHPSMPMPASAHPVRELPNNFARPPPPPAHYGQPSPPVFPPTPTDVWANTAESPLSAYMRYLQNSIIDPGFRQPQPHYQPHLQPHVPGQNLARPAGSGLLPNPTMQPFPSPRMNGHPIPLPSPRMNGPLPHLPSPRMNGPPPLLPSPTSQFLLPSPTGYLNLLSPRSPYPLLSPGYQHPPPLTPNFSFSSVPQSGILGPGPQLPPSPGYGFPLSPSGFFPQLSPRWRDEYS